MLASTYRDETGLVSGHIRSQPTYGPRRRPSDRIVVAGLLTYRGFLHISATQRPSCRGQRGLSGASSLHVIRTLVSKAASRSHSAVYAAPHHIVPFRCFPRSDVLICPGSQGGGKEKESSPPPPILRLRGDDHLTYITLRHLGLTLTDSDVCCLPPLPVITTTLTPIEHTIMPDIASVQRESEHSTLMPSRLGG